MPEAKPKTVQLRMHTGKFLETWVACIKAAKNAGNPLSLEVMTRKIAKEFSDDPLNAPYLQKHGLDALNGDDEELRKKVTAKCRSINASLMKQMDGKSLPMPRKIESSSKAFSVSYFLKNIEGGTDFLE